MACINIVGEGSLDLALGRRIVTFCGHQVGREFDKRGKSKIDSSLSGYANASRISDWLVLRDLDHDAECAAALANIIFANRADFPRLKLRIPIRESETWLLADRAGIAQYLGVSHVRIPIAPEDLDDPKAALVDAAAKSRHRNIREGAVPRVNSGRDVGPEYNFIFSEFVTRNWSVESARTNSNSLDRCLNRLADID